MNIIKYKLSNVKEKSLFESVWEESFDGMRLIDEQGIMILVNKAFCDLVSLDKIELIGKELSIIYSKDSQSSILEHAINRIKTGKVGRQIERELTLWNNQKVWFELSNSEITSEDGAKFILSIFRDITKQKTAQEALLESEHRFRKIFTESTDPVLLLGVHGIIDCNRAALNILGYKHKSEILYKQPSQFSPKYQPDGKLSSQKAADVIAIANTKGYYQFEWIHSKKDGTEFPVEVVLTQISVSGENILHIVWRDILKRKKAEEELQQSEKRYRELFEQSVDIICTLDFNGVFKSISPAVTNILGYAPEELIGKKLDSILVEDSLKLTEYEKQKALVSPNEISDYEIEIITKSGETKTIEVKTKFRFSGSKPFEILAVARDITERKQFENNLQKISIELKESNAAKDKFLSILSHDLKGPFNGFLGITSIIADEAESLSLDELKQMSSELHKSLLGQYKLLEDLLEWSTLQTGRISFQPTLINVKSDITEIINLFLPNISAKNMDVLNQIVTEVTVHADKHLFNTLFRNLLSNALKFSKDNGKIIFQTSINDESVRISVKDNGVGIKEENIQKLFQFNNNITTLGTRGEKGTGFGLILCKDIMEKHGGTIEVESVEGEGTTFYINFPL
ncbi:MAG: PAS domain S-box protein [Ignavibacteria bacterium]|nr:PAS domain S-box protein [Ignavibacteria bacterium]